MAGGGIPQILWGTNFENVLQFGYPIDSPVTGRKPRDGSEWGQSASGVEDAWITGYDYELSADFRWIPDDQQTDPVASPWGGPVGVQAFLDWARQKNTFRYVPDLTAPDFYVDGCYLAEPLDSHGSLESDATRNLHLLIRNPSVDFALALRGIMFEYAPGASLTDPVAATFTRATAATRRGLPGSLAAAVGASDASGVLRDRHYEGALRTALVESGARTQIVTDPENFGNWTAINVTRTSGQADPFGGTAAYKLDATAGADNRIQQGVAGFTSGTRAVLVFLRADPTSAQSNLIVTSGGVTRHHVRVTWTAGVPSLSTIAGTGTLFGVAPWGAGWYVILINADNVVASDIIQIYPAATGGTGTVYAFGANAWNATFPSSYQGPALTTRNGDVLQAPYAHKPQALFVLVDFIERGSYLFASSNPGFASVGEATNASFFLMPGGATSYTFMHRRASDVSSSITLTPALGDRIQLLGLLTGTGTAQIKGSKNAAAEVVGGVSAASALAATWNTQTLLVGRRFTGDVEGFAAFARVKIGPLTFGGVTRDTLAKALLA